ncbi:MAG TPA: BTAD domain-containing putative transcriptional regulator, partial [Streptosporangiaceae bacterium]|nr:BTAD domain-containing putative transcriptional regulator [Streptosporangiaceae bacterium]
MDDPRPRVRVARLLLLHPKARIMLPASDTPVEIVGVHGKVLRLLALSAGHWFSSDSLADLLQYTTPRSVAPMIKQLRSKLGGPVWGDQAIRSQLGVGYQLDETMIEVDAFDYQQIVGGLVSEYATASAPEDLPADRAETDLLRLEQAAQLWRANPAIELEDVVADEHQYYYEYDRLHGHAQRLRILLALRVGTMQRIRESILMLENRVNDRHSPDSDDWCLLIRAYHSTGNAAKAKETYARARRYYDVTHRLAMPRQIDEYFHRSQRHDE